MLSICIVDLLPLHSLVILLYNMLKCANSWYFSLKMMIVKINKSIKLFKQILYESNQIKRTKQIKELNKFNQIKNFLFALFSHETQDLHF